MAKKIRIKSFSHARIAIRLDNQKTLVLNPGEEKYIDYNLKVLKALEKYKALVMEPFEFEVVEVQPNPWKTEQITEAKKLPKAKKTNDKTESKN